MICPNCKNEKWTDEVCPRCGMDQKTALLSKGDFYQQEGRYREAARFYEDYLKLDPGQWDALRKRAIALYADALATPGGSFEPADQALTEALEQEWDWEQGHQFRVNLSYDYGRLEEIKDQYERAAEIPARKDQAEKTMKVILLTERFAAPPADEGKASPQKKSWLSSDWLTLGMILAVPIWIWFIVRTLYPSAVAHGGTLILLGTLLGAGILFYFVFKHFRKEVKTPASGKTRKKSELNFPLE